jgi:hypothetical protein
MSATDARPVPIRGEPYRVTFPIWDSDGDLVTDPAGLDSEVSKDGAGFADCVNEAVQIATSSGVCYLDLTAEEMAADTVAVVVKTSTADAKSTVIVLYPADSADIPVTVEGSGAALKTIRIRDTEGNPAIGAEVWLTSDEAGANVIAGVAVTDDAGEVNFLVDVGTTYWVWAKSADVAIDNPTEWLVE